MAAKKLNEKGPESLEDALIEESFRAIIFGKKVKTVHFAVGVDLLGYKTSMAANKNNQLEATPIGIRMISKGSGRDIIVPYANIKGFELEPNQ